MGQLLAEAEGFDEEVQAMEARGERVTTREEMMERVLDLFGAEHDDEIAFYRLAPLAPASSPASPA